MSKNMTKQELQAEVATLQGQLADLRQSQHGRQGKFQTQAANALLRSVALATSRQEYLSRATKLVTAWSGCRYVGIRVLNEAGEVPYEAYLGFSREFWESENWLSIHRDQCACLRVITGKPEPQDLPAMSRGGSFFVDNSLKFFAGLTPKQRQRFRGTCLKCGFKSLAVIPIISRGKIVGVIHLADDEGGKFNHCLVEMLEQAGFFIGQGLQKFTGAAPAALEAHLPLLMECTRDCVCLLAKDGGYLRMNTAGCLLARLEGPGALAGKKITDDLIDQPSRIAQALKQAAAGAEATAPCQFRDSLGRAIPLQAALLPVKQPDGAVSHILLIAREID